MRLKQERRDDSEIPSTAAESPEEIRVLISAGCQKCPVCCDDFEGQHVVTSQAVLADQPTNSPAEGETGNTGLGNNARGNRQTERMSFPIDITKCCASLNAGRASGRIDEHRAH